MNAFLEPLKKLPGFEEMERILQKESGLITVSGCTDAQKPHMMYALNNGQFDKIIVTFHEQRAKELYEDYDFFDPDVVYYPAKDVLFYQSDIRGNLLTAERINALKAVHEKKHVTLITTFDALMNTMAPPEKLWNSVVSVKPDDEFDLEVLMLVYFLLSNT